MRKRIFALFIFCLILGLFAACSSPARQLNTFTQQLSNLESYSFTAVGELHLEDFEDDDAPLRYFMEGTHTNGQYTATLQYTTLEGYGLFDTSLFGTNGSTYVGFVPMLQHIMELRYSNLGTTPVADVAGAFGGHPYLSHPAFHFSHILTDLPQLVDSLGSNVIRDGLTIYQGAYTLRFTGDHLDDATFIELLRPFSLIFEVEAIISNGDIGSNLILSELLAGDRETYTLELVFTQDADGSLTSWLTLTAPGLLTLTADVTYRALPTAPIAPPHHILEPAEMLSLLADYRAAQERAQFLAESGLEIVFDLPELHMVNHPLGTNLLVPFDIEIGGETFQVSVMANASNTTAPHAVFSTSSAMTVWYTTLEAHPASEAIALFILQDLDVEDFDAENFRRTAMRVNAHNTAAVTALYYDDNLVGRTLNIYVLQRIADTDQALMLSIVVILDNMTTQGRDVLDRLGFYIGLNLGEYLAIASAES